MEIELYDVVENLSERQNENELWKMHNLQFYSTVPDVDVSLVEMLDLAYDRQQVLLAIEDASTIVGKDKQDFQQLMHNCLRDIRCPFSVKQTGLSNESISDEIELRRRDVVSHYLLMLAYGCTQERRDWLLQQEVSLFKWRLQLEQPKSVLAFLHVNSFQYTQLDEEEKETMLDELCESTAYLKCSGTIDDAKALIDKVDFYKVPFEHAADLVKLRKVFVKKGVAYVPSNDVISLLVKLFRTNLSLKLALVARNICQILDDPRLATLAQVPSMKGISAINVPTDDSNTDEVTIAMLPQLYQKSFPPCMKLLYSTLKEKHHLKHQGRMQLGLFLKKLGMTLESSLAFWSSSFEPLIDQKKFDQCYAYNIRHNYGKEGKCCDYPAFNCMKIILGPGPTSDSFHGCPFKHCNSEKLQQLLDSWGLSILEQNTIVAYAGAGRYDKACRAYFAFSHHLDENETEMISHPNQYATRSRQLQVRK